MYIMYSIYISVIFCLAVITRICFIMFSKINDKQKKQVRKNPATTMIILGSGGHTAEMLRILRYLNIKNYSPRIYIYAHTDSISVEKVKNIEGNNIDYKLIKVYRSREVQQSYFTSIYTTIRAILDSIPLLWKERPDLILCNGPGTCVPLCIITFLFKVFYFMQTTIVFIESYCRSMLQDTIILGLVNWELLQRDLECHILNEIKIHLKSMVIILQSFIENELTPSRTWIQNSLLLIEACSDKTWEMLNSGYWKDVPIECRYSFSLCTILKALLLELMCNINTEDLENERMTTLTNMIKEIDKGILLGAPLPSMPSLLTNIASKLNDSCNIQPLKKLMSKELVIKSESICGTVLPGFFEITCYEQPSMETFYREIFLATKPAVLRGCIKHWRALNQWKNLNYLNKVAGNRIVPIEIGSRYTEEDWTQHLISFSDFIQKHISNENKKVGYLAQHQLFDQIPELRNDFTIPEYCNFTNNEDIEQPDINAWFGPAGTVSPLHFDPKSNLLSQVFGYKRVILYHPNESLNLYPYNTKLLNNTAQVDPVNPDYKRWPNFAKAKGIMCYLKPGEMLYIPPNWWHHVAALTPSFSVSFWWN